MSDSFVQAAAGLYHWMKANHIDPKAMRVVLSMPDEQGKAAVELAILREFQGQMAPMSKIEQPLKALQVHGVDFRLQTRKDL